MSQGVEAGRSLPGGLYGRIPGTFGRRSPETEPLCAEGSVMRCSVPAYNTRRLSYSRTRSRCPTSCEGTV